MRRSSFAYALPVFLALGATGASCNLVLGLDEFIDCPEDPKCKALVGTGGATTTSPTGGSGGVIPDPTCTDAIKNGSETDVDCGGSACGKCADDKGCSNGGDCESKVCTGGTCVAASCTDSVENGGETDQDCGGGSCPACGVDKGCGVDGDCAGGSCVGGVCAATCTDGVKDGDESDVDCGGATCGKCGIDDGCGTGVDCETGVCQGLKCVTNYVWAKSFGDSNLQMTAAATADSTGQMYLLGTIMGSVNFGGNPLTAPTQQAISVAKFDTNGSHIWSKIFASGQLNQAAAVAAYNGGGIAFTGRAQSNIDFGGGALSGQAGPNNMYIAKLGADGTHLWSSMFPGGIGEGIAVSKSFSTLTVVGEMYGAVNFGCGSMPGSGTTNVVVATFTATNACSWSKRFDGGVDDMYQATAVASAPLFEIVVAGTFHGTIDFGCGPHTSQGANAADLFVTKLGTSGTCVWSKAFGGTASTPLGDSVITGIAVDQSTGDVFAAGSFSGTLDFGTGAHTAQGQYDVFAAKLTSAGSTAWFKPFGATNSYSGAAGLALNSKGNVALTGSITPGIDFGGGPLMNGSTFATELDAMGNHVWSRDFGAIDSMSFGGAAVAYSGDNNLILAGAFSNSVSFGGTDPLISAGSLDIFLAKFLLP